MTEISETRQRLADTRRMVYVNLLNGVKRESIRQAFGLSDKDVTDIYDYVTKKIAWYVFSRAMPYIPHATLEESIASRRSLYAILRKIGPLTLSDDPATEVGHMPVSGSDESIAFLGNLASKQQATII